MSNPGSLARILTLTAAVGLAGLTLSSQRAVAAAAVPGAVAAGGTQGGGNGEP